jgi:two-component system sensor histidine kinase KdpD
MESPTAIDAATQRYLSETLTLANTLGAIVFTYKGEDIVDTILHFAKEYRVGHIVIGRPGPLPWWKRLLGRKTVVEQLILKAHGLTVVVVDAKAEPKQLDLNKQQPSLNYEAA